MTFKANVIPFKLMPYTLPYAPEPRRFVPGPAEKSDQQTAANRKNFFLSFGRGFGRDILKQK
jgi:hypothetical protein